MNNKEIQGLAQRYFSDSDNLHDYHAFFFDKDELLLSKVSFSWAKAQGHDESDSRLLSMYIVELACQNHLPYGS